ncbi:hypothetical protein KL86DPRO_20506 [uncultured delta proteobacterium]|uniref:Uncharacterized protein n=1 Tax=uncultured delta proteobacterium TaxID=34034 RepID=A0A212K1E5_9DELT|nr:hypothetical protein KL86DPRO_20506 [uncultured delta proteobacterium]
MSEPGAHRAGKRLAGWGDIELHTGLSRKTLLRYGYPVFKAGGTVWALADDIDSHRVSISQSVNAGQAEAKRNEFI